MPIRTEPVGLAAPPRPAAGRLRHEVPAGYGANWLRRDFVLPEFTPVGEQLAQVLRPPD